MPNLYYKKNALKIDRLIIPLQAMNLTAFYYHALYDGSSTESSSLSIACRAVQINRLQVTIWKYGKQKT